MSAEIPGVDYVAVLADLKARRAKLDTAIASIEEILGNGTGGSAPGGSGPSGGGGVRPDSFLKMSIPDATKKFLEMTHEKRPTQDIVDALVKGGLPPSKYNTVYAILSRRAANVGDIVNMKGDWGLTEWYPNHRPKGKKGASAQDVEAKDEKTA